MFGPRVAKATNADHPKPAAFQRRSVEAWLCSQGLIGDRQNKKSRKGLNPMNKLNVMNPCFRRLGHSLFIVLLMELTVIQVTTAAIWRVDLSQTNAPPDGTAWATAFPTVQAALNVATNADSVWVAQGTYFENVTISNGVALYGGFVGNELVLEARNWITNRTTLDGRQSNTVVKVAQGASTTTRIDGFTIRNGRASYSGGIDCDRSSVTIVNNRILWNVTTNGGAGIGVYSGSPVIASNLIQGNTANGSFAGGAGIDCSSSSAIIANNRIVANSSSGAGPSAGGISCWGGSPQIYNNLILANSMPFSTGYRATGLLLFRTTAPRVINNTITENRASPSAPAISCDTNTAIIANNIIAFCSRGVSGVEGMNFKNNCVYGNGVDFIGFANPTGTNGNLSVDPQFAPNLYYPGTHLSAGSPRRDMGDGSWVPDGSLDADGGARIVGSAVDIGADEFAVAAPVFSPEVVHVSPTGDDANDGKTWNSPKRSVQAAMDQSALTGGEVWIRAGSYTNNLTFRSFVNLFGGFAGSETDLMQRNSKTNVTILDGGQAGSVIRATSVQKWGTIDGFVIRNGLSVQGAGIYCRDSSLTIANNTITNNVGAGATSYGAGLYFNASSPVVTKNVISFNRAASGGRRVLRWSSIKPDHCGELVRR